MIHSLVLVLLFYFLQCCMASLTDQGSNPCSLPWKHRVLTPWPGDFLGVDFQSRASSTYFRIWNWNQRSEKDPIAWAIHWMVGIFPVIGSLWGGRDLGEGLLTFEVLFSHPSGDVKRQSGVCAWSSGQGAWESSTLSALSVRRFPLHLPLCPSGITVLPQIILHPQCDLLYSLFKEAAHTQYCVIS